MMEIVSHDFGYDKSPKFHSIVLGTWNVFLLIPDSLSNAIEGGKDARLESTRH